MATQLAHVRVTPIAAAGGFLIACGKCGDRTLRSTRPAADAFAVAHRRAHVVADQTSWRTPA